MRTYQVTRKLQVTIPKALAQKQGIRQGDAVRFEETPSGLLLRKVRQGSEASAEVRRAIQEFVQDVRATRPQLRKSEAALIEGLTRHVPPQRSKAR